MKITLFRAFPDAYRQSMTLYADELIKNIRPQLRMAENLKDFLPASTALRPAFARYLSQYLVYQLSAPKAAGNVNHIMDHSYAHLLHTLPGEKTAVTFHDAIWLEDKKRWGREFVHAYNLSALQNAGAIICDSEASRRALLEHISYPAKKTSVIYPGLDALFLGSFTANPFKTLGIPEDKYILHLGHNGHYKNIPALFHVLSNLRRYGSEVKLLKAGMPFTDEQKKAAQELGVDRLIVHVGLVRREHLPAVYRAAQCLLFPSYNEGFGFPILEAMACGTPVISSNKGSLPELSAHPERLCDPEDYEKMSELILEILRDDKLRSRLIQEGKSKAQTFEWGTTASQILAVYRRLHTT